jgi:hypothetical protein
MPVPIGEVLGSGAGGLMKGIQTGQQYQAGQQELTTSAIKNAQLLDALRINQMMWGGTPPTRADIVSGRYQGMPESVLRNFLQQGGLFGSGASSNAPQLPQPGGGGAAAPGAGPTPGNFTDTDARTAIKHTLWSLESNHQTDNVPDSSAGAIGPMQLEVGTAAQYFPGQNAADVEAAIRKPGVNLQIGGQHADDLYARYNGDPQAVAVGYYAGVDKADEWLAKNKDNSVLGSKTQDYLNNFTKKLPQYAQGVGTTFTDAPFGGNVPTPDTPPPPGPAVLPQGMNLNRAYATAFMKQQLGLPVTDVDKYLLGAAMYPNGSQEQRMQLHGAWKAAGFESVKGGERPGSPMYLLDPYSGRYSIGAQYPRMGEGQILNPNTGQVMNIGQAAATQEQLRAGQVANVLKYGAMYGFGGPPAGGAGASAPAPSTSAPSPTTTPAQTPASPASGAAGEPAKPPKAAATPPAAAAPSPAPAAAAEAPTSSAGVKPPAPGFTLPPRRPSIIPPVSEQGPPLPPAALEAKKEAWANRTNAWTDAIRPASIAEQQMASIAEAFKQIQTGAWQTNKAEFAARLYAITGFDLSKQLGTNMAAVEQALHENYKQTLQTLKQATPRFAQQEFRVLSEKSESPNIQPGANLTMLSEDLATVRRAQELPSSWVRARAQNWYDPETYEAKWNDANPLSRDVAQAR